jgi:hypothetical protein
MDVRRGKAQKKKMQAFINRCLRKILRIRWPETITNEELWKRTGQKPLDRQIKKRKWSWIGHIFRKPSGITEKRCLGLETHSGRRSLRSGEKMAGSRGSG